MDSNGRRRILLVEDETIIALSESLELGNFGYDVVAAQSGEEALGACERDPRIDLILMDIDLGAGMDGPETAELILRERELPIVFLSSHTEPSVVEKTERITSYGYIVKNSSFTVFDASIKMALRLFEANRKLRESEIKQKSMISNISDVIAILDVEGKIKYLSDNIEKLFGWREERLVGTNGWALIHPDDTMHMREVFDELLQKPSSTNREEFRLQRGDGSFTSIELTATNLVDDPVIQGIILNFNDISERKKLEEKRDDANEMFQAVLDAIPQYICWKDRNSVFLGCNKNHAGLFGLADTSSIIGKTDWDIHTGKEDIEKYLQDDREVMEVDAPKYRIIEKAAYPDGRQRWLETNKVPLHDARGEVHGIMIAYSDITERKKIEDTLAQEQYLLGALMDNSFDFIYFKDMDSRFIRVSRALATSLGLDGPSEMLGKTDFDFFRGEHARWAYEDEQEVIRTGRPIRKEERNMRIDRPDIWTLTEKLPLRDSSGAIVGTFGISRDITDRKEAEQRIQGLLHEKELLLHEVHHRVKNSMTTVCSLLSMQASFVKDRQGIKALDDTLSRVQSMAILYEKLYQSSDSTRVRARDYITSLVDRVVESFPNNPSVRVEYGIDDFSLGPETVQPLGIIINELVTNIMKYAFIGRPEGWISIAASSVDRRVVLSIQDDGNGMPESIDFANSSGFGLMLVGSLAEQIHGSIRIERGEGTRVVLEFDRP